MEFSRPENICSRGRTVWGRRPMVCSDTALVFEWPAHADGNLLGGHDCFVTAGAEFLASGNACSLFRVFPFVRQCRAGFLGLSIGWNVARSRVHFLILCAGRISARVG